MKTKEVIQKKFPTKNYKYYCNGQKSYHYNYGIDYLLRSNHWQSYPIYTELLLTNNNLMICWP